MENNLKKEQEINKEEQLMALAACFQGRHGDDVKKGNVHFLSVDIDESVLREYKIYTKEVAFIIEEYLDDDDGEIRIYYTDFHNAYDKSYDPCPIEKAIEILNSEL